MKDQKKAKDQNLSNLNFLFSFKIILDVCLSKGCILEFRNDRDINFTEDMESLEKD